MFSSQQSYEIYFLFYNQRMPKPDLAIIYWFYKEPEITKNHLQLLKQNNPNHKVYGLYGGDPTEADVYKEALGADLDDFWVYPGTYGTDSYTKWIYGNLLLLDWYDKRGCDLAWDSVAITQWDMLVFDDILNQLPGIQAEQVYFAGYRTMDESLENRWTWTSPDGDHRHEYDEFREYVTDTYSWHEPLKACLYLLEIFPRKFFDKYLELPNKQIGMLEYKDPTLAVAWGLEVYEHDLGVYWGDWCTPETAALIATGKHSVSDVFVTQQLENPNGWRIFHPNHSMWQGNKPQPSPTRHSTIPRR